MTAPSPELQAVLDFVSGAMRADAFAAELKTNPGFETLLDDSAELPEWSYIIKGGYPNTYRWLLKRDFTNPGDLLSAQGALTWFLDRRGIAYTKTDEYENLHGLLLDAQPAWLDVDMGYLQRCVLADAPQLGKTALRKWLRERLRELFRYASKPPRWTQAAQWPIREDRPLVFLGQIPLKGYFHDDAVVYVFHDPKTDECETVIQVH